MKSTRSYDSPTRKEHAELTRTKIVQALMDLMVDERPVSVSIPAVAKRANVSVRTVYHHFPTKEALFDALPHAARMRGAADFADPTSPKEAAAVVRVAFEYFERNAPLFNAMRVSEAADRVTPELDRRAIERADKIVAPLADNLDDEARNRLRGLIGMMLSYDSYRSLTRRYGLSIDDAAEATAWGITVLADRAKRTGRVGMRDD